VEGEEERKRSPLRSPFARGGLLLLIFRKWGQDGFDN